MPRLNCTFIQFIKIIESHGFVRHRYEGGSHRRYRGVVEDEVRLITVAYHNVGDNIRLGTLNSMIRQSGLSKSLFRK